MSDLGEVVLYPGDLELIQRLRAGEAEAKERFLERSRCIPRILYLQNSKLAYPLSQEDLLDAAQETFERIWIRLDSYRGTGSLDAWIHRFCCNVLGTALQKRRSRLRMRPVSELSEEETPVSEAEDRDLFEEERIWQSVERLDADYAILIQLKHQAGLTFEAIAERLHISTNTAKTRYYRGLEQVRRALGVARSEAT